MPLATGLFCTIAWFGAFGRLEVLIRRIGCVEALIYWCLAFVGLCGPNICDPATIVVANVCSLLNPPFVCF